MKKIIATLVAVIMLFSCISLPTMAADASSGIRLVVEYDIETGILKLSGTMSVIEDRNWATYYMLNPGKTRDDIKNHTAEDPVFSHYGEIYANSDGTFEHTFKHTGTPGDYTLYFTTGYAQLTRVIDTTKSIVPESGSLEALKSLPTSYKAPTGTTVKTLFEEKVAELPIEMPVVSPAKIEGLSEVFVDAEKGDDATADGTIEKPFKTINAALEKFPATKGRVLYLRKGTYEVSDSISLNNITATEELPFIISNYDNEEVILTGGTKINGAYFEEVTDKDVIQRLKPEVLDDVLVIDLKEKYGMTKYGSITTDSQPILFVGESKYRIARWPNSEDTIMRKYEGADGENGVIDSGYINVAIGSAAGSNRQFSKWYTELINSGKTPTEEETAMAKGVEFCIEDLRPFSWVNTGDIWVYGKFYDDWTLDHLNVVKFNPEKRSIRTKTGVSWGCRYVAPREDGYQNSFYYYNVLEELDTPGEWFMDKNTGKLYVYPTGDISDSEIILATSTNNLLEYYNMKNFIINGIRFEHARGTAIHDTSTTSENVIVQNCSFEDIGSGVNIRGKYSGVINSTFKDLDGEAVTLEGGDIKTLVPTRQFIQNCVFYNTTGISVNGVGQIVSHNLFSNNSGSNIYVTGNENVIEYNEIVAGPRDVEDSGCIYVNGNQMFNRGNHVRYNYIHDVSEAARAIYFDDMLSENYAYGNIVDGSWFQIHTGSENTVYNNIFLNYNSNGAGPIRIGNGYWKAANTGDTRWLTGALNYGSFTSRLKDVSYGALPEEKTITGPYAERYPLLKEWAERMYQRIDEYNDLVAGGMEKAQAAKTSSIASPYIHTWEHTYQKQTNSDSILGSWFPKYETVTETVEEQVNLNDYLSSARDNYIANNIMVNCGTNVIDMTKNDEGKYTKPFAYTASGTNKNDTTSGYIYINTFAENNIDLDSNPFTNGNYGDASIYESYGIEPIPFDEIGLLSEEYYVQNGKTHAISPMDTTAVSISGKDLLLQWISVPGAQEYTVEIATDENFENKLEIGTVENPTAVTTYDLSYKVETSLESDTTYYWKVTSKATAICATGEVEISGPFKFKTMIEGNSVERNQVGVTVYSVDDMDADSFKVTTYAYNATDADKDATIHIACYGEDGRLISTKSQTVTIPTDAFTEEIEFNFTAPGTKKIKLFVWSADGKMTPYTFVKTL